MKITVKDLELYYEITGDGPDILFLHGWGSSLDAFRHMIAELSSSFRCIAVDLPGFGKSAMPKSPYDIKDYGSCVLEFMKGIGLENPILAGHSNGGRIALYLTGTGKVNPKKMILLDSAGIKPKKSLRQKLRQYSFKCIKWALTLPGIRNHSGALLDKARGHYGSADYKSAAPVLRQTLVSLVNEDLRNIMPNIKASTLLIWGEKDTATPLSDAKIMEKLIPDAGLCVIKHAGHFSFIESPAQVDAILRSFLTGE